MSRIPVGAFARSSLQLPRAAAVHQSALSSRFAPASRRWASSAPKIRYGFRGSLLRWGIAVGGVYWYATQGSKLLADEPAYIAPVLPHTEHEDENLPTVDDISAARRARQTAAMASDPSASPNVGGPGLAAGVGDLEDEAEQQGAFNPETGEINWDCPCLGGMADGPCGPEFKAAFSCFVFSKEEPKGMDCVDRFKGMQDCFRKHPEIYGEELEGDEEEDGEHDGEAVPAPAAKTAATEVAGSGEPHKSAVTAPVASRNEMIGTEKTDKETVSNPHELSSVKLARGEGVSEHEELVPRNWHDTTADNAKPDEAVKPPKK